MCVEETMTEIYIEMDLSISASLIEEASGRPGSCERASRSARACARSSIESRPRDTRRRSRRRLSGLRGRALSRSRGSLSASWSTARHVRAREAETPGATRSTRVIDREFKRIRMHARPIVTMCITPPSSSHMASGAEVEGKPSIVRGIRHVRAVVRRRA